MKGLHREGPACRSARRTRVCAAWFAAVLAALPWTASAQHASSGAFRELASIESALQRGVTTQAQVRRLLGEPNGGGAARFATLGGDEREIWYYEDIELTRAKADAGVLQVDVRQQILLVIFKEGRVDGYLWTSNAGRASPR